MCSALNKTGLYGTYGVDIPTQLGRNVWRNLRGCIEGFCRAALSVTFRAFLIRNSRGYDERKCSKG
jgi:hypothetical protein